MVAPSAPLSARRWIGPCFFLSGFAALLYETVWGEMLSLVFGTTDLSIAAVLVAYMGGLALGAALAARWAGRFANPLRTYAVLELGIAVCALAMPWLIGWLSQWPVLAPLPGGMASSQPLLQSLVDLFGVLLVLLLPTMMMGATLPVLIQLLSNEGESAARPVGGLYMLNTIGAALGALTAGFLLLPMFGMLVTSSLGVLINFGIFLGLWFVTAPDRQTLPQTPDCCPDAPPTWQHRWVLLVVFLSGFVALGQQVFWTRLLTHLVGSSIYAFSLMLFIFLLALSLGAYSVSRMRLSSRASIMGLMVTQLGVAACFASSYALVQSAVLPLEAFGLARSQLEFLFASAALGLVTLFPSAFFMGAAYPLAVTALTENRQWLSRASGLAYTVNTTGAILGALLVALWVLPEQSFSGTARWLFTLSLIAAMVALLFVLSGWPRRAGAVAACLMAMGLISWAEPLRVLLHSPLSPGQRPSLASLEEVRVGRSSTVVTLRQRSGWTIRTNGLPESTIQQPGDRAGRFPMAHWLSMLPAHLRPQASELLIVGLGAGITVNAVPDHVAQIDVIELEPEVLAANQRLAVLRGTDPLSDPRVSVHINDARSALENTSRRFDLIVSQPSHPWTSHASHLFSQEFASLSKRRLNEGGVFAQWIGLNFIDERLLKSMLSTLLSVFDTVEVYQPAHQNGLLLVASDRPLPLPDWSEVPSSLRERWGELGVFDALDLELARRLTSEQARRLSGGVPVSTDLMNLFQTQGPRMLSSPLRPADFIRLTAPFDRERLLLNDAVDPVAAIHRLMQWGAMTRVSNLLQSPVDVPYRQDLIRYMKRLNHSAWVDDLAALGQHPVQAASTRIERATLLSQLLPVDTFLAQRSLWGEAEAGSELQPMLDAYKAMRLGRMDALRELDPVLASIEDGHPWRHSSLEMRIAWRLESDHPAHWQQARPWLDGLITVAPTVVLLQQRTRLACLLEEKGMLNTTLDALFSSSLPASRLRQIGRRLNRNCSVAMLDQLKTDHKMRLNRLLGSAPVPSEHLSGALYIAGQRH